MNKQKRTHYQKLWSEIKSEDFLSEILTFFYEKQKKDPMLEHFFCEKDLPKIVQGQKKFLLFLLGQTQDPPAKNPSNSHLELPPIFSGQFDRRKVLLKETLEHFQFSKDSIELWLSLEESFRNLIVSR